MTKTQIRKKNQWGAYIWLAPAIVLVLVFSVYPALSALMHSFTKWDMVTTEFILFDNFIELFQDNIFYKSVLNLIILMVTGLIIGNASALFLAELLHNTKSVKVSNLYRFIFILPILVPSMVNMLLWAKIIFYPSGLGVANAILGVFNIAPSGWYLEEGSALFSMILTGFPWVAGTSFLIYLAGLNNVPESVYEAAKLDGITPFKRVFLIDLPLLKSQIKYFLMMGVIGGMQSFSMQLAVTSGGPNHATNVPGYYMYTLAFSSDRFGYAAAIGFVLFIVTLVLTIISNKFMKSTEEAS